MKKYRVLYILLLLIAFVFALTYKGNLSTVILVSLLVLPAVSFLLLLAGYFTVKAHIDGGSEVYQKSEGFKITVSVRNVLPFPLAPLKITADMPDIAPDGKSADLVFSADPMRTKKLNLSYCLKYRGKYRFALKRLYCYDLLRIFCLKKDISDVKDILVLPCHIVAGTDGSLSLNESSDSAITVNDSGGSDLNFIRKYNDGDALRQIHWKLSAKQDDYMVRQMARNKNCGIAVFCDLREYAFSAEENAEAADRAIETALALSYQAVQRDEEVTDCWYDVRGDKPDCACVTGGEEYWSLFNSFASVRTYAGGMSFASLVSSMLGQLPYGSVYCLVTPRADAELAELASRLSANSAGVFVYITGNDDRTALASISCNPLIRVSDVYRNDIAETIALSQQTKRN